MVNSWGHVEVAHVSHVLPDGRTLLDDVSFRIGEGLTAALVGPNGEPWRMRSARCELMGGDGGEHVKPGRPAGRPGGGEKPEHGCEQQEHHEAGDRNDGVGDALLFQR